MENIGFRGMTPKCLHVDDQPRETLVRMSPEQYFVKLLWSKLIIILIILKIHTYFGGHFECVLSCDCYCSTISLVVLIVDDCG